MAVSKRPNYLFGHFKTLLGFKTAWLLKNLTNQSFETPNGFKTASNTHILLRILLRNAKFSLYLKRTEFETEFDML